MPVFSTKECQELKPQVKISQAEYALLVSSHHQLVPQKQHFSSVINRVQSNVSQVSVVQVMMWNCFHIFSGNIWMFPHLDVSRRFKRLYCITLSKPSSDSFPASLLCIFGRLWINNLEIFVVANWFRKLCQ